MNAARADYPQYVPLRSRDVKKYIPLQELLDSPRIRILRLLSRHDWISGHEIAEQLGVLWSPRVRNAYAAHLSRLSRGASYLCVMASTRIAAAAPITGYPDPLRRTFRVSSIARCEHGDEY